MQSIHVERITEGQHFLGLGTHTSMFEVQVIVQSVMVTNSVSR